MEATKQLITETIARNKKLNQIKTKLEEIANNIAETTMSLIDKNSNLLIKKEEYQKHLQLIQEKKNEINIELSKLTKEELKEFGSNETIRNAKINEQLKPEIDRKAELEIIIKNTENNIEISSLRLRSLRDQKEILIALLNHTKEA